MVTHGSHWTLRSAEPADAARLAELSAQLGYAATATDMVRRLTLLAGDDHSAVFVAESDVEGIVGWLHVGRRQGLLTEPDAEIHALVVDERRRGAGVGSALVRAAEAWARERGCASLRVRCNVIRTAAHAFYRSLGFNCSKRQDVLDKLLAGP
jgi:GNAT superfamily N-acetyltransferase